MATLVKSRNLYKSNMATGLLLDNQLLNHDQDCFPRPPCKFKLGTTCHRMMHILCLFNGILCM